MANPDLDTGPKELVLCFDGTGYVFRGDESDSNILKIYRMLESEDSRRYHYYQPGFGTLVSSTWMSHHGRTNKAKSGYLKAKDAAIGTTFAQHVMGGYIFLMRHYAPGDKIYFFGFSRGAYVARFLAEMLDTVGLIKKGNEEIVRFAWKIFSKWQRLCNKAAATDPRRKQSFLEYITAFRETFSSRIPPICFLGLFDTVNSTPAFQSTWRQRSKLARSSAKVIRHAVGIDERRTGFRPELISDPGPASRSRRAIMREKLAKHHIHLPHRRGCHLYCGSKRGRQSTPPVGVSERLSLQGQDRGKDEDNGSTQDIEEVWFPGCHADIGGGFNLGKDEENLVSHVTLVWMVHAAQRAGLQFDSERLKKFNCYEDCLELSEDNPDRQILDHHDNNGPEDEEKSSASQFQQALYRAGAYGQLHDCLQYGKGVPWPAVLFWRLFEYLPFQRMGMKDDGTWKPVRFPLPLGEVRDIPRDAKIHISAVRRMKLDPDYRPGNLIEGGGGRGKRKVDVERGIGEWEVAGHAGSPVRETYHRKGRPK